MLVKIGKYKNWIGPYQIADTLQKIGVSEDKCDNIGQWLSDTWVSPVCTWIGERRKQKVSIRIDKQDTWSMDQTLAHIILPMLKQLQETKHGSPFVDDEDVPEELKSTSAPATENDWDTDDNHHKRWDWAMDQMIFAFESQFNEWEEQFHTGVRDIKWKKLKEDDDGMMVMINGPDDTSKFDSKGHLAYQTRISNGYRLFGKYFESLWD
jgi:hypothetical protein